MTAVDMLCHCQTEKQARPSSVQPYDALRAQAYLSEAQVGAHALAAAKHVPDFDFAVKSGRQQQVPRLGEKLDSIDALGVATPGVNVALGDVAELVFGSLVLGSIYPGSPGSIAGGQAMEPGLLLQASRLVLGPAIVLQGALQLRHSAQASLTIICQQIPLPGSGAMRSATICLIILL